MFQVDDRSRVAVFAFLVYFFAKKTAVVPLFACARALSVWRGRITCLA